MPQWKIKNISFKHSFCFLGEKKAQRPCLRSHGQQTMEPTCVIMSLSHSHLCSLKYIILPTPQEDTKKKGGSWVLGKQNFITWDGSFQIGESVHQVGANVMSEEAPMERTEGRKREEIGDSPEQKYFKTVVRHILLQQRKEEESLGNVMGWKDITGDPREVHASSMMSSEAWGRQWWKEWGKRHRGHLVPGAVTLSKDRGFQGRGLWGPSAVPWERTRRDDSCGSEETDAGKRGG